MLLPVLRIAGFTDVQY